MIKFNIGDRVRFIGDPREYDYLRRTLILEKGDAGTVKEKSSVPYVLFDKCPYKDIAISQNNLELVPVNSAFKVGDRVRMKYSKYYTNSWHLKEGTVGTVVAIRDNNSYTVRFDNWHHGHDGDIDVSDHSCLYLSQWELEHIGEQIGTNPIGQPPSLEKKKEKFKFNIVIYRKDNKVIAQLNNGKCVYASAEAKCSLNDTFNFAIGSQIALQRLCRKMGGMNGSSAIVIPEDLKLNELFMY